MGKLDGDQECDAENGEAPATAEVTFLVDEEVMTVHLGGILAFTSVNLRAGQPFVTTVVPVAGTGLPATRCSRERFHSRRDKLRPTFGLTWTVANP